MISRKSIRAYRLWPTSLFGRIALILFFGLSAAHILSLGLLVRDRAQTVNAMMFAYLAKDVASSIAILERLPAEEREEWVPKLNRRNYRYIVDDVLVDRAPATAAAQSIATMISRELGPKYVLRATAPSNASDPLQFDVGLKLQDGTPLLVELTPPDTGLSWWVMGALAFQLAILALFSWIAVRIATHPLARLARAADELGPDFRGPALLENGPKEVARAAVAFNAMQRRIANHIAERVRMLAAISHDLQSPITRMRLRTDFLDDSALKQKLQNDLTTMQALIEECIDLARSDGRTEAPVPIDVQALLESLVYDYADSGRHVSLLGVMGAPVIASPHTLRRIITNLVDNALKFGQDVEILIHQDGLELISISVRDRGVGIPDAELESVLEPFYRVEDSRNRETGGAGLGLAIAQRLSVAIGGELRLSNRPGGGLEAKLTLPIKPVS
ncbi:sensor histidine kinase [soil metagenome]